MTDFLSRINDYLSTPISQIVAGTLFSMTVTAAVALLFPKVREKAKQVWQRIKAWCLGARPRMYRYIGIAPKEDLKALELWIELHTPSPENKGTQHQNLVRWGLRFSLDPKIYKWLGKTDPGQIGSDDFGHLIHGPFCTKCYQSLVFRETGGYERIAFFHTECPACKTKWAHGQKSMPDRFGVGPLKEVVYKALDAEFRRNGKLAELVGMSE